MIGQQRLPVFAPSCRLRAIGCRVFKDNQIGVIGWNTAACYAELFTRLILRSGLPTAIALRRFCSDSTLMTVALGMRRRPMQMMLVFGKYHQFAPRFDVDIELNTRLRGATVAVDIWVAIHRGQEETGNFFHNFVAASNWTHNRARRLSYVPGFEANRTPGPMVSSAATKTTPAFSRQDCKRQIVSLIPRIGPS